MEKEIFDKSGEISQLRIAQNDIEGTIKHQKGEIDEKNSIIADIRIKLESKEKATLSCSSKSLEEELKSFDIDLKKEKQEQKVEEMGLKIKMLEKNKHEKFEQINKLEELSKNRNYELSNLKISIGRLNSIPKPKCSF